MQVEAWRNEITKRETRREEYFVNDLYRTAPYDLDEVQGGYIHQFNISPSKKTINIEEY